MPVDRQLIRKQVRQARRALSADIQHAATQAASERMLAELDKLKPHKVALYLSNDGELNTQLLIDELWRRGIDTYLPRLHPFSKGNLQFYHYDSSSVMMVNCYGIAEPKLDIRKLVPANTLDVIITPLVAFDAFGNRMGMGMGFYDRTLAHRTKKLDHLTPALHHNLGAHYKPMAIGFAHDCQQVESLPTEHWDVPLDMIITPKQCFNFNN